MYCLYCGKKCENEIWAGPPTGMKGDFGQLDCKACGYNIIFRTQDFASIKTAGSVRSEPT